MKKTTILIFLMTLTMSVFAQGPSSLVPSSLPTVECSTCVGGKPVISSIVSDGFGGVYIGGTFTKIGSTDVSNLAHVKYDNTVDLFWKPVVTGTNVANQQVAEVAEVKTIAVYGQFVFIGGVFSKVGECGTCTFNNFAAIRISDGQGVNTITVTYPVNKILLSGNIMYIAANASDGTIGGIGTTVAKALIGTQSSDNPSLTTFSEFVCKAGTVYDMALDASQTTLYIGGKFTDVNGSGNPRLNLAAVNSSTGSPTTWVRNITGGASTTPVINIATAEVKALEISNNKLFVGGTFNKVSTTASTTYDTKINFVAYDLASGNLINSGIYSGTGTISAANDPRGSYATDASGDYGTIYDLTSVGNDLIIVGNMNKLFGASTFKIASFKTDIIPTTVSTDINKLTSVNGVTMINFQIEYVYATSLNNIAIGGDFTSPQNHLTTLPYVALSTQTLTFQTSPVTKTYGDAAFTYTATTNAPSATITYSLSNNTTGATINSSTGQVTLGNNGTFTVTATSTAAGYSPASKSYNVTVNKKDLTATADNKSRVYNAANPSFTITYSGFVNGETVANITAPTASTTATQSSDAGSYVISLTGGSATNYNILNVAGTLTINKADQTITFNALTTKTVGDASFNLTATSTSGLTITYVSSNINVATVTDNTVTIVGAGSTIITASQTGNTNYNAATLVDQTLVVNAKIDQTITFNSLTTKTVGDANFNLTATASSGLAVTFTSSNASVATVTSSGIVTIVGAGSTIITASQAGNSTYNAAPTVDQTLTVNPAPTKTNQTITFNALTAKTFGDANFDLTATASSGLLVTYISSNTTVAEVNGTTVTIVGAGSATITASQAGNDSFNAATSVDRVLTVNKANQTITFDDLSNVSTTDAPFELTATSSSNLLVSYTSSNTSVATVSGSTVTIVGAGTTTITASQLGNANYNAATAVQKTLTVIQKQNQTITFNALPQDKKIGDEIQLTATASSNLEVEFSSSDDNIAEVMTGNKLVLKAFGTVTITAHQKGDDTYNSVSVYRDITVNKKDQTITFNTLANDAIVGQELSLVATSTSGLGIDFESSNPAIAEVVGNVLKLKAVGTVTIKANQKGNEVYKSVTVSQELTVNSIITSVVDAERPTLSAYPNPTTDVINIQTASSKMKQIVIYTMDGRVMDQLTSSSEEVQFTVSSYNTGIYIVKISDSDNSATVKFVKK